MTLGFRFVTFAATLLCLDLGGCSNIEQINPHPNPAGVAAFNEDVQARVFTVGGDVYHPGKFHIKPGQKLTLAQALSMAGGLVEGDWVTEMRVATPEDIRLMRMERGVFVIYRLDVYHKNADQNFLIKPGDNIFVNGLV